MKASPDLILEEYNPKREKKKSLMLHEYSKSNDIKFHGPLSYRHLRIIGWITLALSQAGLLMKFGAGFWPDLQKVLGIWPEFLTGFESFMMPLFLLATFSVILTAKNGYRKLIIQYSLFIVGIYAVFAFVYLHYLVGLTTMLTDGDRDAAMNTLELLFLIAGKGEMISFNIFIDLLLCTLFTFFINYTPSKFFQGKWRYLFRSFAILPVAYEVASIILKIRASFGDFNVTVWIYPLLTTKPPVLFIAFLILSSFIKVRERIFLSRGLSAEQYKDFLKTNINSFHFALVASILLLTATVVDQLLSITLTYVAQFRTGDTIEACQVMVNKWGFGQCVGVAAVIPIVLLFDYKKTYKDGTMDVVIPIVGVGLLAFVYLEGLYWFLRYLPDLIKEWSKNVFK